MKYRAGFIFFVCAICAGILSLTKGSNLPEKVPMHWNLSGQVDRLGSRAEALYFMPIFLLGFSVLFGAIGLFASARLRPNTIRAMNIMAAAIGAFMLIIHRSLLSASPQSVNGSIPFILPGLLLVLGFAIKDVEPNPFVGIRVSWTMNNPIVWRKTHDRASKLWIVGGALGLLLAILGAPMAFVIAIFAVCILYPLIDSYAISQSQS